MWPWSNTEAIVSSQFPEVAALGEAAVAASAPMIDMKIGSAVLFALVGFSLVTGVEVAGKLLSKKNKA